MWEPTLRLRFQESGQGVGVQAEKMEGWTCLGSWIAPGVNLGSSLGAVSAVHGAATVWVLGGPPGLGQAVLAQKLPRHSVPSSTSTHPTSANKIKVPFSSFDTFPAIFLLSFTHSIY